MAILTGVVIFLLVVLGLHLAQPGYDPRHQLMSELALGPHGELMLLAFSGLCLSFLGLSAGMVEWGGPFAYRVLLGAAGLLFLLAGIFPLGKTAVIHISVIAMAFVTAVLAISLLPKAVAEAIGPGSRLLSWVLATGVAASVFAGQDLLPMGIAQRLAAACLLLWLGVLGWRLYRSGRS